MTSHRTWHPITFMSHLGKSAPAAPLGSDGELVQLQIGEAPRDDGRFSDASAAADAGAAPDDGASADAAGIIEAELAAFWF